jgi:ADP-ribose pyrophosphatase YjhB (NUDIX family)
MTHRIEDAIDNKAITIFLGNSLVPTQIVLLKRSPYAKFAPNTWAGIDGKFEPEKDKTMLDCALRKLKEESGKEGIKLTEFGKVIVNNQRLLSCFYGVTDYRPLTETLSWVPVQLVALKRFIADTEKFIHEWKDRQWSIYHPFTMHLTKEDMDNPFASAELTIEEGLPF